MLICQKFGDVSVWITTKDILDSKNKIEINWSALGGVSVEDAEKFCLDFQSAIKFAKEYKFGVD